MCSKQEPQKSIIFKIASVIAIPLIFASTTLSADTAVRDDVFKSIGRAQTRIVEQHYDDAKQILNQLIEKGKNAQEKAMAFNALGYCYFMEGQSSQAINAYEKALQQSPITEGLRQEILTTLGQLYFADEQYNQAIKTLEKVLSKSPIADINVHITLAQAYFRDKQFSKSLAQTKITMDLADKKGIEPKEQWLTLLRVLHQELNEMTEVAKVLEKMVRFFPRKKYWLQLASIYGTLDEQQKQLSVMEIAYQQNVFTESREYVYLAHLYLRAELPYKAAQLIHREIESGHVEKTPKNLYLESQSWLLAQELEKSIPPLEKASALSDDGNYAIQLGQIYMSLENWSKASELFKAGITKGGLHRPDNAYMALGTAFYHQKEYQQALDAFSKAGSDERSKAIAKQWIDYLNSTISSS